MNVDPRGAAHVEPLVDVGSFQPRSQVSLRRIAYVLLLATIVTIPIEEVIRLPGLGTIARLFGLAAFSAWALSAFVAGKMRKPDTFHVFVYGLVLWVGLSLLWSLDAGTTIARIETFLQLLALTLIVWDLCDSKAKLRASLQALVLGLWIAAASVFINFLQGTEAYYGRFAASGAEPNYLSVTFALGMPLAWYLSQHTSRRVLRVFNLMYLPVAAVAMGLSGSRGGLLAALVAIGYILITIPRLRATGLIALFIVAAGATIAIAVVIPPTAVERFASLDEAITQGDLLTGRVGIWREASEVILDHPLVGVGAGATRAVLPTGKVGHNVAVTIQLELGIVGLALFGGIIALAVRHAGTLPRPDRRLWLAMLAVWGIGALSLSLETRKITWIIFSLAVVAGAMTPRTVSMKGSRSVARGLVVETTEAAEASTTTDDSGAIDLATSLRDRDPIPVPLRVATVGADDVTDLNQGSAADLAQLHGIGPVLARRIIAYREHYGPFEAIEDLLAVRGIGKARLALLRSGVSTP